MSDAGMPMTTALELYGTQTTLWLAAALNLLIAVVARTIDRHATGAMEREPFRRAFDRSAESLALHASAVPELDPPANPAFPARTTFLLLASGAVEDEEHQVAGFGIQ